MPGDATTVNSPRTERQLMGRAVEQVAEGLRDRLAARLDRFHWTTEYLVGRTPVDVAGEGREADHLVLVELEWRRADPANNPVKLYRHVVEGTVTAEQVTLIQAFSGYYDLADGGVSSKRLNAEFAGTRLSRTVAGATYLSTSLPLSPRRGAADPPDGWREAVATVADTVATELG